MGSGAGPLGGGSMVERNLNRWTIFFAVLFFLNAIILLRAPGPEPVRAGFNHRVGTLALPRQISAPSSASSQSSISRASARSVPSMAA